MTSKPFAMTFGLVLALAFCWNAQAGSHIELRCEIKKVCKDGPKDCHYERGTCHQVRVPDETTQALGDDQNDTVDEDIGSASDVGIVEDSAAQVDQVRTLSSSPFHF